MSRPIRPEQLAVAAQQLDDAGHADSAALVREVAAPDGWKRLRAASYADMGQSSSNLALSMDEALKMSLKAEAARLDATLSIVVAEGYQAVLDGRWTPPRLVRPRSGDYVRSVLNVRLDNDLRDRVRALLPKLTQSLGYRVTESGLAVAWLAEELGVDLDQFRAEKTMPFTMWTYSALLDFWRETAGARQSTIDALLAEELRGLRDGSWVMERPSLPRHGASADESYSQVVVRLERELGEWLVEAAPRLSSELNYSMTPTRLVTQVLRQRLGVPAGFPAG